MKIYASLCLIVITMLSLAGCGGGGDDGGTTPDNRVTSLVIAPNQQLNVGAQRRLQFTARTAAGTDVTSQLTGFTFWTSSNTAILSFNGDVARGVSNGTATVRVSYTNPGGQVVTSAPVQVTVGTAIVNPVARAFAAIPATGPYSVTFTPTGGVATTLTNSVALGSFSTFTPLAAGTGRVRVFENGTQRSSREVTIGADDRLSFVVAGTPANTVIAVV
ncbi:MAG: hypothetical protein K0Q55_3248, partial [Verrucomicrobia bacterium]|nr:hypothetical protein [Verrucomicrobiota bacterium]